MNYKEYYKNPTFCALATFLNLGKLESFKDAYIEESIKYTYLKEYVVFKADLVLPIAPLFDDYLIFLQKIKINKSIKIEFNYTINTNIHNTKEMINYISYLLQKSSKHKWLADQINNDSVRLNSNYEWEFHYFSNERKEEIEQTVKYIEKEIKKLGFKNFSINAKYIEQAEFIETNYSIQKKNDEAFKTKMASEENQSEIPVAQNGFKKRTRSYLKMSINNIFSEDIEISKLVSTTGVIYKSSYNISTKGKHIYSFFITDYEDAIEGKWFRDNTLDNQNFNIGSSVNILGAVGKNFKNQSFLYINDIIPIKDIYKKLNDDEKIKRVELNTKSKMNTMDGILSPSEIVNNAKFLNHKAVALMDSDGVQGFPEFTSAAKKAKIKPIYGVSFNTIKKQNNAIYGTPSDKKIRDSNYVSFDIETTGLSPRFDDIIEFGATFIENGKIVKKEQFFIKTSKELSSFTVNLTKITNKILQEEGIELKTALQNIYNILNNNVAIAHNSNFDIGFLFEKFKNNNIDYPNTLFIDTLVISRIVFPKKSKHKLVDFTSNFGIVYNKESAHRADYDSDILAKAWISSWKLLEELNIYTFNDLYKYESEDVYKKKVPSQISVIALNQKGLKELFNLVTLSLTERYFSSPKIFLEDIKKSKNILIGSSTLRGFIINNILYGCERELDDLIELYDYIEIPSISNFKHKIEYGEFTEKQIQDAINYLYKKSVEKNKIVVAVGDVRYLEEKDKTAFEMLVYAKAIGGERHYLFDYQKAKNLKIPNQTFLTTKQMIDEFSFLGDQIAYEIVVENTNKINDLVEDIQVIKDRLYTPQFDNSKEKLKKLVYDNAKKIYGDPIPKIVDQRIKKEIEPITKYGFDVVYWISHILTKKSTDNGFLVGSRGSVGSSIVATLSNITEVNPLQPHYVCPGCKYFELSKNDEITSGFDLDDKSCPKCGQQLDKDGQTIPFETFLGFEADKVPDIDLNFSGEYQSEIHNEVKRLFGDKHTFRAGTISTAATKTSYGYVKNAVEESGRNISDSFVDYLTTKIEGVKRTTGQHPGGIIIIPKEYDVEDFTPVNFPADDLKSDWKTTHFDFHAIHDNVLKIDILGHDDPTAIRMLEKLTGLNVKKDIPKTDKKVMSIFSSPAALGINSKDIGGEKTGALGIPEFGTPFVRKMLEQAKVKTFADLVSVSGLSHGTDVWINNAQRWIIDYNLSLKDTISCRDDIMVHLIKKGVESLFAFKIMEQVRKGNGVTESQEVTLKNCGIDQKYIDSMRKIKYMFPKAHATAYVIMAWRIAWFKVYKPLEYYAVFFTIRTDVFDIAAMVEDNNIIKINKRLDEITNKASGERSVKEVALITTLEIAREMYARGFSISNINLNTSIETEWIVDHKTKSLIPPFSAIDGLGYNIALSITNARKQSPFLSKEDFAKRTAINKTQLKQFEDLGIFNDLPDTDQNILF